MIFTYVWAFDVPSCVESVARYPKPFPDRRARVLYAELQTTQQKRPRRNEHEWRLAQ
jgi:hypothetical protein